MHVKRIIDRLEPLQLAGISRHLVTDAPLTGAAECITTWMGQDEWHEYRLTDNFITAGEVSAFNMLGELFNKKTPG